MGDLEDGLRKILGDRARFSRKDTEKYSRDTSFVNPENPIAVLYPKNVREVSRILEFCNGRGIKITARGGGSSLTGASTPVHGGAVLIMKNFNKIIEISTDDQYAVVQSNVTIDQLNRSLERYGYVYPPDPGSSSIATIGGTIATNAGGLRGIMYGSTRRWILGLEMVLANGSVINTGSRTLKLSRGYDLTSLVVGSEGTLGVVTSAIVRIEPEEAVRRVIAYYDSMKPACSMLIAIKRSGMSLINAEFMDTSSIGYMSMHSKMMVPKNARFMVMLGFSGNKTSVAGELKTAERIINGSDNLGYDMLMDKKVAERIYFSRKKLHQMMTEECRRKDLDLIIGDLVVPLSELYGTISDIEKVSKESGLKVVNFGHMGEGNIHANIFANLKEKSAVSKAHWLLEEFGRIAIKHHGSVSAEHGIGIEKKNLLIEELKASGSIGQLELMRGIKRSFDPNNILNPGKIFD